MQYGGRSSVGRAQDCGSWCRGFDSHRPPHIRENARPKAWRFRFKRYHADVVKLVDTPDLGSGAARCESSSLSVRTISSFYIANFGCGGLLHCARVGDFFFASL